MILPKIIALVALLLASPAALHASEPAKPTARPNILWLTAEDANVTCFGCYGNRVGQATTPNIDKLAAEAFSGLSGDVVVHVASSDVALAQQAAAKAGLNAQVQGDIDTAGDVGEP